MARSEVDISADRGEPLVDRAFDLSAKSTGFCRSLPPSMLASLADLERNGLRYDGAAIRDALLRFDAENSSGKRQGSIFQFDFAAAQRVEKRANGRFPTCGQVHFRELAIDRSSTAVADPRNVTVVEVEDRQGFQDVVMFVPVRELLWCG